mgnify:CR=1 FL=1
MRLRDSLGRPIVMCIAQDIARSLSVSSVRVVEVIEGKSFVGIEIPNTNRKMVRLTEILSSQAFKNSPSNLTLALGHDIAGKVGRYRTRGSVAVRRAFDLLGELPSCCLKRFWS